jgi:hypothetical protein
MRNFNVFAMLFLFIVFVGCSGGGSGNNSPAEDVNLNSGTQGDGTGTVMLSLTDAPNFELEAVFVTIDEVKVCQAGIEPENADIEDGDENCEWLSLMSDKGTYDLLTLTDGVTETLGIEDLPAGIYSQMRLMIGETPAAPPEGKAPYPFANYAVVDGVEYELKIPSGVQSGIKLVHPFEVLEGRFKELVLDFDAKKSVVKAGNSGKFNLKPTIKVIEVENLAMVSGVVKAVTDDESNGEPIEGANVYAFLEENGEFIEAGSGATTEDGYYELYLENEKEYAIVANAENYASSCSEKIYVADGMDYSIDFNLLPKDDIITRDVHVTIESVTCIGGDIANFCDDGYVEVNDGTTEFHGFSINFKQEVECLPVQLDVFSKSYDSIDTTLEGYPLEMTLPVGTYTYTASMDGHVPIPALELSLSSSSANPHALKISFFTVE